MAKQDRYCDQDVAVEIEVDNKAPSMPAFERPIWQLDQEINETGVMIDKPLVERANTLVDYAKVQLNRRLYELTGGAVERASMVRKLAKWVNARGVECTTIGKGDQEDLIFRAGVIADDDIIQAIEIRRSASKTSTSKLERMLDCVCADGAIYFQLHYFGAHTGRWAGRLVQLQNLYRTDEERDGKDIDITLDLLQRIPDTRELHDALMAVLGDVMTPIAKCMRRFIIARPGNRLIGGDLSNIEGCVNAWLADETWKIDAYRAYQEGRGPDLYVVTYAKSFGVDVSEVTKPQRQLGKVEELALGYQGSVGAFYTFTQTYLMKLDDILPVVRASATPDEWDRAMFLFGLAGKRFQYELTREMWAALRIIVDNYRKANPKIVQSWWDRQDAAITAVGNPGNVVECLDGKIRYLSDRGFLWCMLPSGSVRAYCDPMLVTKDDSFVMFGDGTRHGRDEYEAEDWNKLIVNPDVDYYKRIRNQVQYKGYHGTKRVWGFKNLYGGLQCENDVSGTSRDILVAGMFRAKAAGYKTVLTVHDEILCEMPIGRGSKEELRQIMTAREYWYAGLPLAASTWEGSRYEK
jgi:DNA polymerase